MYENNLKHYSELIINPIYRCCVQQCLKADVTVDNKMEYPGPSEWHETSVLTPVVCVYVEETCSHDEDPHGKVDCI